jgi:quinol monooxygenase YgiN
VIVLRFKITVQPEKREEVRAALAAVVEPARATPGVVSFDIAGDLLDENTFIATEVFEDEAARDRQESLPEVARVMELLPTALTGPPDVTAYEATPAPPGEEG